MSGRRGLTRGDWFFTALMLALAAVCLWLGTWQMQRLGEKEALIAAVDLRQAAAPIPVPPKEQWAGLDSEALVYQPVELTGAYRYTQTVTVFTSLAEVRRMTEDWRHRYNYHRPHRSLGGLSPVRFAMAQSTTTSTSS